MDLFMRSLGKICKILIWLAAIALSLAAIGLFLLQTNWGKRQLEDRLLQVLQTTGFTFSAGSIEGSIPLQWKIRDLVIDTPDGTHVTIPYFKLRLGAIPLLRKELAITYLKVEQIKIVLSENFEKKWTDSTAYLPMIVEGLPFSFSIRSLKIGELEVRNEKEILLPSMSIQGLVFLKKENRDLLVKLRANQMASSFDQEIFISGGSRKKFLKFSLKTRAASLSFLPPSMIPPIEDITFDTQVNMDGPWNTWQTLALGKPTGTIITSTPIQGKLFGKALFTLAGRKDPWKAHAAFTVSANRTLQVTQSAIQSDLADAQFHGKLLCGTHGLCLEEAAISLSIPDLSCIKSADVDMQGSLGAQLSFTSQRARLDIDLRKFLLGPSQFDHFHASMDTSLFDEPIQKVPSWRGIGRFIASTGNFAISGQADLKLAENKFLLLDHLQCSGGDTSVGGNLFIDLSTGLFEGNLQVEACDLASWKPVLPLLDLGGSLGIEARFKREPSQSLLLNLFSSQLHVQNMQIGALDLHADLHEIFSDIQGALQVTTERIYFPEAYLSGLELEASSEAGFWPFTLKTQGTWKDPFTLKTTGKAQWRKQKGVLLLDQLQGTFLDQALYLQEPLKIGISSKGWSISPFALSVGEGILKANASCDQKKFSLSAQGEQIPLSWMMLFTPYLSLYGNTNLDCSLRGNDQMLEGYCRLELQDLEARQRGNASPLRARGTLQANFSQQAIQVNANLVASNQQLTFLHLSIPISYQLSPLQIQPDLTRQLSGSLTVEGKIEEIFDFVNTGAQRFGGWLAGHLAIHGTWNAPLLRGDLEINNGIYENYIIGLHLERITATLHAENQKITIEQLKAHDEGKGWGEATGFWLLDYKNHFPFLLSSQLHKIHMFDFEIVDGTVSGPLEISGDTTQASAKGSLHVDQAALALPQTLPTDLPDLPVTFIHQPAYVEAQTASHTNTYPFSIDLFFDIPEAISFNTHGLTSQWIGALHLHGVNLALFADGYLHLVKGHFNLLGKTFTLTQGDISFSDKPGQEGVLNVSGTTNMNDVTITALLRGPLTSPQLSFQSHPPLPTSDILSLVLFNKKINEIKPVQALQLARTAMTLSGSTGWNVVDHIGNSLSMIGIDTFDIIPSEKGLNQTSIQLGKQLYLVRGVLVTLKQSLQSSQFRVEVDLGQGITFEAENESGTGDAQSQQEGKFSLKWNKNY